MSNSIQALGGSQHLPLLVGAEQQESDGVEHFESDGVEHFESDGVEQFEAVQQQETNGIVEAKVICLGDKFVDGHAFSTNFKEERKERTLLRKPIQIHLARVGDFRFEESGFEFVDIDDFTHDVRRFASNPCEKANEIMLLKTVADNAFKWAKAKGLKCAAAVPFNIIYRHENVLEGTDFKPFPCAHIDFPPSCLQAIFRATMANFRPTMEQTVGPLSGEEYLGLSDRIVYTINYWIPLNGDQNKDEDEVTLTQNTLTLLDRRSFKPDDLRPCVFGTPSQSIHFKPGQVWVAGRELSFGKAIIFDSQTVPHCAVVLPKQKGYKYDPYRKSVEIRIALIGD